MSPDGGRRRRGALVGGPVSTSKLGADAQSDGSIGKNFNPDGAVGSKAEAGEHLVAGARVHR